MKELSKKHKFLLLFSIFFVIIIVSVILIDINIQVSLKSSDVDPKGIRLTVINDPSDSIVITWYTEGKASDPKVEYSINSDLSKSKEQTAISKYVDTTFIYTAEITELKANTTYFYQVYSDTKNKEGIYNFTTAAGRSMKHVEFIVFGLHSYFNGDLSIVY